MIVTAKEWLEKYRETENQWPVTCATFPTIIDHAATIIREQQERIERLTAELKYREAEVERLNGKLGIVEAESRTISEHLADADYDLSTTHEELKSWRKLAQDRLADQEAIERHTRRETARECAEIAEAMWSDHYWAWPAMQTYAAEIRKKYGVE